MEWVTAGALGLFQGESSVIHCTKLPESILLGVGTVFVQNVVKLYFSAENTQHEKISSFIFSVLIRIPDCCQRNKFIGISGIGPFSGQYGNLGRVDKALCTGGLEGLTIQCTGGSRFCLTSGLCICGKNGRLR